MAVIHTYLTCELQKLLKVQYLDGNLFSQDNQANEFHVIVLDNGEPATISGSVTAEVIRSDGGTVPVTGGTIEGNVASITFNAAVYAIPGVVSIVVKLTTSGVVTTIAAAVTNVYQSSTSVTVDPGTIIPSIQTLISSIETAVASIPADYSSLWTSLAPAFSSSASYVAGQYCTYNGGFYRFNTPHTGSWAAGDVTAVNIGGELTALKSALNRNDFRDDVYSEMFTDFADGTYLTMDLSKIGLALVGSTRISVYLPCIINSKISINCTNTDYQYSLEFNGVSAFSWETGENEYVPTANGTLLLKFRKPNNVTLYASDVSAIISALTISYYPNSIIPQINSRIDDISDATLYEFKNLFDDTTKVSGGYYNNNGNVSSQALSNYSTQVIPVRHGKTYTFSGMTGDAYLYCGAYNSSGTATYVRRSTLTDWKYVCPNDVDFIKVSLYLGSFGEDAMVVEGTVVPPEYIEYNEKLIYVKKSAIYPEAAGEKKCKVKHTTGGFSDFTNVYATEYLSIFIPMNDGYYEQTFAHCENEGRNADNWRLSIGYKVNDSYQRQYNIIIHGEYELAVALPQKGYIGGIAHGNEITDTNGLKIFIDGVATSVESLATMASFDRMNIIEQSTLYDPDDAETAIANHSREYIITKDGVRVVQSLKWLIDTSITRCFMAMLPIAKNDNIDTSLVITDKYYSDVYSIPQSPVTREEVYIDNAKKVTLFGSSNKAFASLETIEYPDSYVGGKTAFITDNDGGNYNKLYFQISSSAGGNSVTNGTLWKSITEYKVLC